MLKKILISVITPSFNQAAYIEDTIKTVLQQETGFNFEYLVMDGGSTDGTLQLLENYSGRLTWFSEPDKGQSDALNKGIAHAQGEIIGWLNSDDLYLPGTLQKVADYFTNHPDCDWLYGRCRIVDDENREIRKMITWYKNLVSRKFHLPLLLIENFISQPAVFFRQSAFEKTGPLALDLPLAMDYDLWLRMAMLGPPGVVHDYLASFRVHRQAKSAIHSRKQFLEQFEIHKKYDKRKLWLFLHRLNIARAIGGYWLLEKWNQLFLP